MRKRSTRRLGMDLMMMLFLSICVVLYIVITLISEPLKKNDDAPSPQGNLIFELYWPDEMDTDVDLWVRADADKVPVGYSNKGGPLLNLLRDDLGKYFDISNRNMEITYSRGIPDGEYVVNAHLFALKSGKTPVPIKLVVSLKKNDSEGYRQLFTVDSILEKQGEERTIARFFIKDGEFVKNSFSTIQEKIRSFKKEEGF